jgi:hypothetical protein
MLFFLRKKMGPVSSRPCRVISDLFETRICFTPSMGAQFFEITSLYLIHGEEWTNTGEAIDNEDHTKSYLGDGSCPPVNRSTPQRCFSSCICRLNPCDGSRRGFSAEMPQTCEPHGGEEAVFRGARWQIISCSGSSNSGSI